LLCLVLCAAPALWAQAPTVYINGDSGVSATSGAFALGSVAMGGSTVSKHDKTTEMARSLLKSCPGVSLTVSNSDSRADYLLLLSREESRYGNTSNQVMVLRPDKSVVFASKEGSVARASRDGCKAIMADWKDRRSHTARTEPTSTWDTTKP
jgi:hypothetical protein